MSYNHAISTYQEGVEAEICIFLFLQVANIYISNIIGSVMEMLLYIIGGVCLYAPLVGTSLYAAIVATYLVEPFGCSISYNYSVAVSPGLIAFSWCIAATRLFHTLKVLNMLFE
ncbi:predicted protein [Postia placenta Mad-698-R]|nr:predicted protein [Postia placenta Mad-698-R]